MESTPPITERIGSLLRAILRYVEARGELLQIEAREAGSRSVVLLIAISIMIAAFVLAWFLAMPAVVCSFADLLVEPYVLPDPSPVIAGV